MKTRTGKIARLPRLIRDQLNHRLDDGQDAATLLPWLNDLPEVRQVLAEKFAGHPISPQNLSEWKTGGFQEWRLRLDCLEQALEMTGDATELAHRRAALQAPGVFSDQLAAVLTTRYAALINSFTGEITEEFTQQLRVLHQLTRDVAILRRADHDMLRLSLLTAAKEAAPKSMTAQEKREAIRHILSLPSPSPQTQSDPIKPCPPPQTIEPSPITPIIPIIPIPQEISQASAPFPPPSSSTSASPEQLKQAEQNRLWRIANHFE